MLLSLEATSESNGRGRGMRRLLLVWAFLISLAPAGLAEGAGGMTTNCDCESQKPPSEVALCKIRCRPPASPVSDALKGVSPSILVPNAIERPDLRGQIQ